MTTITEADVEQAAIGWQVALARRQRHAGQDDVSVSPIPRKIEKHILPEVLSWAT